MMLRRQLLLLQTIGWNGWFDVYRKSFSLPVGLDLILVFLLVGLDLTRKSAKVGLDLLGFSLIFGLDLKILCIFVIDL